MKKVIVVISSLLFFSNILIAGDKEDVILDDFTNKSLRNSKILLDRSNILIDTLIYEFNNNICS